MCLSSTKLRISCRQSIIVGCRAFFFYDGGMWIKQNWSSSCVRFHFMSKTNVYPAGPVLEPLSAPQPTFKHGGYTFSNCSLLHKLLITGQGEQVVSRRRELNRDLLSSTCEIKRPSGYTLSKVRIRVGLKCRLRIEFLTHT